MHVCLQWLLHKYTIYRALDGDLFSKSYIELNILMVYDRCLHGIHLVYTTFVIVLVLSEEMHRNKIQNFHHNLAPACTYKCQCGRHDMNPRKARFAELVHMTGRYQVYVCHIWSTARFLAFLVYAARRDVSDLVCVVPLWSESPPIRGWGRPKFHSPVLIS